MSLAEAFERDTPVVPAHKVCGLTKARAKMCDDDRDTLDRLMGDEEVQASAIGRALRSEGYDLRDEVVQRHRRRSCSCDRVAA